MSSDKTHHASDPSRRRTLKLLAASAGFAASFPAFDQAKSSNSFPQIAGEPRVHDEVDVTAFGRLKEWDGSPGVQWDEPREIWRIELDFADAVKLTSAGDIEVEYWVRSWPPVLSGGWTEIDTPSQGAWFRIETKREIDGNSLIFRFAPLSERENPNAKNQPGYTPSFRRTLKVRLRSNTRDGELKHIRAYSGSRWSQRQIAIYTGCDDKHPFQPAVTTYNGVLLDSTPIPASPRGTNIQLMYTDHAPESNDRTVLTIRGGSYSFGVSIDDVIERRGVYVRPLGVLICDATAGENLDSFMRSGVIRLGQDIVSRTSQHTEQSLDNALSEIPRLALTARRGRHPFRYTPLGFTGSREKYGLDFNGNVFISKRGSKAMKEDLGRMLWKGDEIYFRIGAGQIPDFRERETGTRQEALQGYLPLITTKWQNEGIEYEEAAYATMLSAPLDEGQIRGDEPSILFLRLLAHNSGTRPAEAQVWLAISPGEKLKFQDGVLFATGDGAGSYPLPRLRAALDSASRPEFQDLPPESAYRGSAARWLISLAPGQKETVIIKIPFRTMVMRNEFQEVSNVKFETRLDETLAYWKKATSQGMQIRVPDEMFNRFFRAVLQHILVSQEKDPQTGYTMCPCGTYDYNVFANETNIQVRLLNMRGLHDAAWRCLQPLVELQGSEPFPGQFTDTSAELHGARIDKDHDYTMGGYNLDHGWTLWTIADHYFFARDRRWLQKVMPHIMRAANWIIEQRRATKERNPDGTPLPEFGLLPPGDLEDNNDWEHWFAVNGYAYRGLMRAAEAISDVNPGEGDRLRREANAYRQDIRQSALRAMPDCARCAAA